MIVMVSLMRLKVHQNRFFDDKKGPRELDRTMLKRAQLRRLSMCEVKGLRRVGAKPIIVSINYLKCVVGQGAKCGWPRSVDAS